MPKRKRKSRKNITTAEYERSYQRALSEKCVLRLYVTGITSKSTQAISNVRAFCDEYLSGRYDLEVIDIYQQPAQAIVDQIIAAPTLIKQWPEPVRKIIGDLTDPKRVRRGLDVKCRSRPGQTGRTRKT